MHLVYLSPVPWSSFAQRPHKFVEWFREVSGGQILWVDPYATRLPSRRDLSWRRKAPTLVGEVCPERITVIRPRALPIEPLPGSGILNQWLWKNVFDAVNKILSTGPAILGVGKPSELALQLLATAGFERSFYDAMDDFPAFYDGLSRSAMAQRENKIVNRVSKVFVSSTQLLSKWTPSKKILLARNACDLRMLPPLKENRTESRPVIGYVGTIGQWFDWDLVFAVARARPSTLVRLIGPIFLPPSGTLPFNVELLPSCSHSAAIAAMQDFTVGLIPFKQTQLTRSVDPIKYYEYRALGLPVISSAFGEMHFHRNEGGVFILENNATIGQIDSAISAAMAYQPTLNETQNFRLKNSWKERFSGTGILL